MRQNNVTSKKGRKKLIVLQQTFLFLISSEVFFTALTALSLFPLSINTAPTKYKANPNGPAYNSSFLAKGTHRSGQTSIMAVK